MWYQAEDVKQIGGQSLQLNELQGGKHSYKQWLALSIALIATAALLIAGIWSRVRAGAKLRSETSQVAVTPVSVVSPERTTPAQEIILPGNVQPFITSPIYSRTNGYLGKWYVAIGARVKQGQLLAVIDTAGGDEEVEQSLRNLSTLNANLALAEITKNRYEGLLKSNAVSQQDVDNAVGAYNANKAIVEASQANVKQLQALQSFEKIYAPFDGVVTARNTDIGDLINSRSIPVAKHDLFHIAQPGVLRVYVNVPEGYSQVAKPGLGATLSLAEFPGKQFPGKLVRKSEEINSATRTLLAEVDVNNPTGQSISRSYAGVHF